MNDLHFSRRATPPTEKMIWRERLWEWRGGFGLAAFILAFAAVLFSWRYWQVRDAANAPLQTANAVVVGKAVSDLRGRAGNGWDITLQLNGKAVTANTHNLMLFNHVNVGDTVAVAFSVGRSGRVYVAELAETAKQRVGTNPAAR
jgi:hypothetical protein